MIVLNLNTVTAKIRGKTGQALMKNLSDLGCFLYNPLLLTVALYHQLRITNYSVKLVLFRYLH